MMQLLLKSPTSSGPSWSVVVCMMLMLFATFVGCGRKSEPTPVVDVVNDNAANVVQADTDDVATANDVVATKPSADEPTSTNSDTQSGFTKFDALMAGLSIFALAVFVGFEVITKVPPTLHTPLMSGSNAISGITLVGALLVAGRNDWAAWLGVLAVVFAMINVIGGFWVTHRMLAMFKR